MSAQLIIPILRWFLQLAWPAEISKSLKWDTYRSTFRHGVQHATAETSGWRFSCSVVVAGSVRPCPKLSKELTIDSRSWTRLICVFDHRHAETFFKLWFRHKKSCSPIGFWDSIVYLFRPWINQKNSLNHRLAQRRRIRGGRRCRTRFCRISARVFVPRRGEVNICLGFVSPFRVFCLQCCILDIIL